MYGRTGIEPARPYLVIDYYGRAFEACRPQAHALTSRAFSASKYMEICAQLFIPHRPAQNIALALCERQAVSMRYRANHNTICPYADNYAK